MTNLERLLREFQAEVGPDFFGTDIVGNDGLSICSILAPGGQENTGAEARMAVILKLAQKTNEKLNLGDEVDNMITTDIVVLIGRYIGDGSYFWSMGLSKDATLGNIRLLMNEYAPKIWDAIPR